MESNVPGGARSGGPERGGGSDRREVPAARVRPIEPTHLYKAAGLLIVFLLLDHYLVRIARVLLIAYAAAIAGVAMNVVVGLFPSRRRIVTFLLGLFIFGGVGAALWLAVPVLGRQLRGLAGDVPRLQSELARLGEWIRGQTGLNVALIGDETAALLREFLSGPEVIGTAWGIVESIFLPLIILIGGMYAVAKPNAQLLSPLIHAMPRDRRDDIRKLFATLGDRLKGWVRGTLVSMFVVGLLTTVGLWIIGVRYALLLGVISGVLEIIPIAGPWVAGIIAVAVAFIDDPSLAIWVALLMFGIQQAEGNLITPLVMSQAAKVHPFVTLFALFLFGTMFGFLGIILAVPLVLLIWTAVEVLWVDRAIKAGGDRIEPLVRE